MRYRVGEHVLDSRKFELREGHRVVPAEPQVLSLLLLLIDNRDRLVSKDELVATIWGGRAVSDSAISSRIKSARKLLGDDGDAQRLIRTIHGKGFRFIGQVAAEECSSTVGAERTEAPEAVRTQASPAKSKTRMLLAIVSLATLLLAGVLLWRPWDEGAVTFVVTSASQSQQSADLARDLNAKLAMLGGVNGAEARLLESGNTDKADFRFNIDAFASGSDIGSNLALLDRRGEILWSTDLRQRRTQLADLKQQLAVAAAKVLLCALDAESKEAPRLDRHAVKLYLAACAKSGDMNENTIVEMEQIFRKVVDAAPRFRPGWRKLLLAQAAALDPLFEPTEADLSRARATLAEAQKIDPALPEIYVLQAATAQPTAMSDRMRFIDRALSGAPENGDIAAIHSFYLLKVGRLKDAAAEAIRSVQDDPLSPSNREQAILALAIAGRVPEAEQQLVQAEALWPGATSLREARFTLHLRIADPGEAIRLRDSGLPMPSMSPFVGSFLAARVNPTPANVDRALRDARALYARTPIAISHLAQTLGAFHHEQELFGILLNWQHLDRVDQVTDTLFRPALRSFRHDPRFMRVAARLGLLQYWQSSGKWPDFCFDSDLPYDCKAVAAAVAPDVQQARP